MHWVYSGAVSREGHTLLVRRVLTGERRRLRERRMPEEGHGSSLCRSNGELPLGRLYSAELNT